MKKYNFVITAEEAKEATKDYSKLQDEIELEEIFNKIAKRIRQGFYWLSLNKKISFANKEFLEKYGYKVDATSQYNEPLITIIWY